MTDPIVTAFILGILPLILGIGIRGMVKHTDD